MKKITLNLLVLAFVGAIVFGLSAFNDADTKSGCDSYDKYTGPVSSGYTGSPSDGNSCLACHASGGAAEIAVTGWVTSDIPVTGYVPGNTYTFTVTNGGGTVLGFQGTSEDASGAKQGIFSDVGTDIENPSSNVSYIGHTSKTLTSRTFDWTAPAGGTGTVTFYTAIINGDNTGGTKSNTHLDVLAIDEHTTSIEDYQDIIVKNIQNPNNGVFNLEISSLNSNQVAVNIVSIQGQNVYSNIFNDSYINETIDLTEFSKGVYFVKINDNNSSKVQKIIIE